MALNFKFLLLSLLVILFFGCSDSNDKKIQLLDKNYASAQNSQIKNKVQKLEDDIKIEISKIQAQNKLEIAKVEAENKIEIEKVKSSTSKDIALADAKVKTEDTKVIIYIAVIAGILLFTLIVIFYLNNKKNRDMKLKLHEAELKQQKEIAEREMEEKRLQMMINLVTEDKLPKEMQEELVSLMGKKSNLIIESKIS
ncbi:MAG: hypothetical protein OQJ77_01600 [Thiovulaceae bacterium]|nr:hypothetical protein [Sulfurimonadaceae bacterium]MCW9025985.1 hypothetical protein [Sulfurimonadaceae bacterium]